MTAFAAHIEKYYPYAWVILFFISYLVFFPENWMITDSYNYVNRAIAFSQGSIGLSLIDLISGAEIELIPAPYNLGTSACFAAVISILGKSSIFLVPLFQVIFSVYFLSSTLKRNGYSSLVIALLSLSMSLMFFSRSMMSCMPSFLMVSMACWLFFREEMNWKVAVGLGIIGSLSLWFRESNIFLIAPFVIHTAYYNRKLILSMGAGLFLGLGPKVLFDKLVYGKYWFLSASSGFSPSAVVDHLPEYSIILIALIPLSLIFLLLYRGKGDKSIKVASAAFILLYLIYDYSAVDFSGLLKGSFLTSRFMIPLLPLVVICAGEVLTRIKNRRGLLSAVAIVGLLAIPVSQFTFHKLYAGHEFASKTLSETVGNNLVIADYSGYTNIIRYYNPLTADVRKIASIQNVKDWDFAEEGFVVLSRSTVSEEKQIRADSMTSLIEGMDVKLLKRIEIDGKRNWLEVYKRVNRE